MAYCHNRIGSFVPRLEYRLLFFWLAFAYPFPWGLNLRLAEAAGLLFVFSFFHSVLFLPGVSLIVLPCSRHFVAQGLLTRLISSSLIRFSRACSIANGSSLTVTYIFPPLY